MNLKITTSSTLSIGTTKTNIYGTITQHAYDNTETGGLTVPCDLKWWATSSAAENGFDQVWPLRGNDPSNKLSNITVELTAEQTAAPGLPLTIYEVVADAITSQNPGMTVIVEQ